MKFLKPYTISTDLSISKELESCSLSTLKFLLEISLNEFRISLYYYYAIPLALIIALIFLNYFAFIFGQETNLRKDALDKIQEVISKEHELVSL